jgi:hypothetical protein
VAGITVIEKVVEVEADQQELIEQLRAQMRAELAGKVEEDLGAEALAAARAEAEANARSKLEEKMAESNATEEERRKLREALRQQLGNMQARGQGKGRVCMQNVPWLAFTYAALDQGSKILDTYCVMQDMVLVRVDTKWLRCHNRIFTKSELTGCLLKFSHF